MMPENSDLKHEFLRVQAFRHYKILDTEPEADFDNLTRLAASICQTPIALVSLVDDQRQWFKSKVGLTVTETPRDISFCHHAILQAKILMVPDTLADKRFATNPLVVGEPYIRFYAGAPLITAEGHVLGTLCVIDQAPRQLQPDQVQALQTLSQQVVAQLELRRKLFESDYLVAEANRREQQLLQEICTRQKAEAKLQQQTRSLQAALQELRLAQVQLIQNEKLSSLGTLVAGLAHEINNPITFISANIVYIRGVVQNLMNLVSLYQAQALTEEREPTADIQQALADIDWDFLQHDLPKLFNSVHHGIERVQNIVVALRTFSRSDEAKVKKIDVHQSLDSTLLLLQNRIRTQAECTHIQIIKEYGDLPLVQCYPGPLNQVLMNVLVNAIDAIDQLCEQQPLRDCVKYPGKITICTTVVDGDRVEIAIADNGVGIPPEIQPRIFDPFFTTKPVGKGVGLGLSISHQVVTKRHSGSLDCYSRVGRGTKIVIQIPIGLPDAHDFNPATQQKVLEVFGKGTVLSKPMAEKPITFSVNANV